MPGQTPPKPMKNAYALDNVPGFSDAYIQALAEYWIDSVQEFLSMVDDVPGGREQLRDLLGLDDDAFDTLAERARKRLPKERGPAKRLEDEAMEAEYDTGALEPPPKDRAGEKYDTLAYPAELPNAIDYTGRFPPQRNQGGRGTCVAHAAAAVRELMEIRAGTATADEINLSEQFIYWWCKEKDKMPDVSGTYPQLGMECLVEAGTVTEAFWPYNARNRLGDESQGPPPAGAAEAAARYRIKRLIKLDPNDVDSLKRALADGKAILFAIPVFNSWYRNRVTRRFGKIGMPLPGEKKNGAHAMALVGYVDDKKSPGGGYFLLRNSWSPWAYESSAGPGFGTIPYAFLAEHNMSATTGDRASMSDVYIRDNEEDDGSVPSAGNKFNSPDIWVRHENDGQVEHQMPRAGQTNWLYVRAWNLGPGEAQNVQATIYQAPASPSIWPENWQEIGVAHFSNIAAGDSGVAALAWTPPDSTPLCFLARLNSPDDPVQHEWSVRNDNNLAQKNLIVLQLRPQEKAEFTIRMNGLPGKVTLMDLSVDRRQFKRGRVELRMADRPRQRGRISLIEDEARLADLAVEATDSETVGISITADERAKVGDRGEIVFTQRYGRLLVGRLVVQVEIV